MQQATSSGEWLYAFSYVWYVSSSNFKKAFPFCFFFLLVEQQHDEKVVFATIPFQEEQKEVLRS